LLSQLHGCGAASVRYRTGIRRIPNPGSGIEKGEVELEYRGAYHWGVPQVTDTNENANDLVQSHEFEPQMGVTDWWLLSVTAGLDQPPGENLQGSAVGSRPSSQCSNAKAIALSFQTGYEQAFNHDAQIDSDPNQFGFGPIVGDGSVNLNTKADALASTANFLKDHGWIRGEGYQPGEPNFSAIQGWNAASVYQSAIAIIGKQIDE
jgi:hypothetical protein